MSGLFDAIFGSDPPPAPDYTGAAQATAAGNLDAAKFAAKANRVNQYTPYGNLTYSQNPDDTWNQFVSLNGTGQQLLDQQNKTSMGLAGLQDNATARVAQQQASPFDYGSVQDVQDKAYGAYTSRLDPQWNQRQAATQTQLANQGIAPGTEAYTNAMRDFNNGRNDAYQQANIAAINTAPQTMQMATALRNQPLNELNAIRTGSQVTNPTFNNVPQQATTAGPDYLGAANMGYQAQLGNANAQSASSGNFMSGLMGLGGSVLGAPAGSAGAALASSMFSDARLKSNIKRVGKFMGHNLYHYVKFGCEELGVMAQEVMQTKPEAVSKHPSGYYMVNYGAL